MSKDIIIKRDGVAEDVDGATKLSTSGRETWVPEDEVPLSPLSVTQNGTYTPPSGVYGYNPVTVDVPKKYVTGKGADGNTHRYSLDDQGNIVDQTLAEEIRVTTLPNMLIYFDGETIDFTGLVVTAYDANGDSMGEVPFGELVFPVTEAEYDPETDTGMGTATLDDTTITYRHESGEEDYPWNEQGDRMEAKLQITGDACVIKKDGFPYVYFTDESVMVSGTSMFYRYKQNPYWTYTANVNAINADSETTYGGVQFRYGELIDPPHALIFTDDLVPAISDITHKQIGTILFDGTRSYGAKQSIPVEWARTGDGRILETTYSIDITPQETGTEG